MSFMNDFPHTSIYDKDLGWLIRQYKELNDNYEVLKDIYNIVKNQIHDVTLAQLKEWLDDGTLESIITKVYTPIVIDVKKIVGEPFSVDKLNSIIKQNPNNILYFDTDTYYIDKPIVLLNNDIIGNNSTFINKMTTSKGSVQSIFSYGRDDKGNIMNRKNISNCTSNTDNTITLGTVQGLKVGDLIGSTGYVGEVLSIDSVNNTITVNNIIYNSLLNKTIYKFNTIHQVIISNLNINMNNKYGYGVTIDGGIGCVINNVNVSNLGGRAVQVTHCVNSKIENCMFKIAFDTSEGSGYGVRIDESYNTYIHNITGIKLRHDVDVNMSYYSLIEQCTSNMSLQSYTTHDNGSYYTTFRKCVSNKATNFAFGGFTRPDKFIKLIECTINNSSFTQSNITFQNDLEVMNCTFNNAVLSGSGTLRLCNCLITHNRGTSSNAFLRIAYPLNIDLIACVVELNGESFYDSSSSNNIISFIDSTVILHATNVIFKTQANNLLRFINCTVNADGSNQLIDGAGTIEFNKSSLKCSVQQRLTQQTTSVILIDSKLKNVQVVNNKINKLTLGNCTFENVSCNVDQITTIECKGLVNIGPLSYNNNFINGSMVIKNNNIFYKTSTTWKQLT